MKKLIIIFVFILALFLRVYKLGQFPVGFLWDEAALGYNAYSILETGRDEYGKLFPLIFKSFGDYKPGFYVYLTIPSVAVFGLNEFAVRLPSAIAGSLTVILLYLLLTEAGFTQIGKRITTDSIPLVAALLLAISPWHINFSRGAWELNVMTFEIVLGFFLLLRFLNSNKNFYLFSSVVAFVLSFLTYQTAKFLTPALLIAFIFLFKEKLKAISWKQKFVFVFIFSAVFFLFSYFTITGGRSGRIKVMSLFSYPRSNEESTMIFDQDNQNKLEFALFHSSPIFFTRSLLGRYFNHFSGRFLFFSGDWSNPRNGIVYQGVMYFFEAIFVVLGLGVLLEKRNQFGSFIIFWLLVSPLFSALTRDSISSVRSFPMVIPLVIITAFGISSCLDLVRKSRRTLFLTGAIIIFLYGISFVRLLDLYFIHDPKANSKDRLFGYKEMVNYLKPLINQKNKVIITTSYGQPYIFYLFYSKYDPKIYQMQAKLKESPVGDVGEVEKIGKIEFRKIYWPDVRGTGNSLFVGDEFDLPLHDVVGQENISLLKEIKFLNGNIAFRIVETR